jgi:nickel/cobalt exporter
MPNAECRIRKTGIQYLAFFVIWHLAFAIDSWQNQSVLFLLISALFLGFLHGLGADHLMAIAALSMENDADDSSPAGRRARALGIAARFAAGHAVLLGAGAGIIVLIGWSIPAPVERGGEMLGGALLIVMGLVTLQHLRTHYQAPSTEHRAPSTEHGAPTPKHSHLPAMIGAAFAVSSLRALAMLTPFGDGLGAAPVPVLLALIALFAVGILISMSLFGVALAGVLSTTALRRMGQGAGALVGVSSVVLGVAWVVTA